MVFKLAGSTPQKPGRFDPQKGGREKWSNGASRYNQYQASIRLRCLESFALQKAVNHLNLICAEYRHVGEGAVQFTPLVLINAQWVQFSFRVLQGKLLLL